jgi:ABC-type antimicrobial peptide transport system permease subunit
VTTTTPPVDVVNYARVVTTPTALAILMALIAALTVTYLVAAAQYRRRHEFAILKTLGFTRRQVLSTVMGQASTLTALALLLGLPAGIVLGRFVWTQFADSLAVADQPITPTVIVLAVPIALLAACLLAIGPGIRAGRLRPAAVFRTD